MRDWLFSRQRYWGEPFPILHFDDNTHRALSLDELPLIPPDISNYKPSVESPLSTCKDWVSVWDHKTGKNAKRETNTMPQWAGSCWYYLRFCDPTNNKEAWSQEAENYWMPVDTYIGGVEHAVLHLLYARFWHKVLYDCGLVSTLEPFQLLRNQGLVTSRSFQTKNGSYVDYKYVIEQDNKYLHKNTHEELKSQVEKMSKSKLNGITPDEIIDEFGADALRVYEMFMGPLEKEKIWNTDAVNGAYRFLTRFYDMAFSDKVSEDNHKEALKLGYRLLHGTCKDIENLQFNTAIAKMMEFINDITKLETYPKFVLEMATQVLSWFAPHIAEEVWQHLGHNKSIAYSTLPTIDEKYLYDDITTYVIQVNGKLRGRFETPKNQNQETILDIAKNDPRISKFIIGEIKKVIFVPNKLLNIVVH